MYRVARKVTGNEYLVSYLVRAIRACSRRQYDADRGSRGIVIKIIGMAGRGGYTLCARLGDASGGKGCSRAPRQRD